MKKKYVAPTLTVVEIETENILAASGTSSPSNKTIDVEDDWDDISGTSHNNNLWGD